MICLSVSRYEDFAAEQVTRERPVGAFFSRSSGPFIDPLGRQLIDLRTPGVMPAEKMWLFDPAAFIDDDARAYLCIGGNGDNNVRVALLQKKYGLVGVKADSGTDFIVMMSAEFSISSA
ncbi:MAG: hypothetical protein ABSH38_10825 [Verrucomicrobiota bacterium]